MTIGFESFRTGAKYRAIRRRLVEETEAHIVVGLVLLCSGVSDFGTSLFHRADITYLPPSQAP